MKKLIRTIRYSLIIAIVLLSTTKCSESYLELDNPNAISESIFPTSINQVGLLVASVYGVQHHWGFYGHYWLGYGIYCLDHTIDLQWRGDDSWIGICTGLAQGTDGKLQRQWLALYRGIYYANSALEGIKKYRAIALSTEKGKLDYYEGEVIFLRAYYLWHLQTFYGQPNLDGMGVPIITSLTQTMGEMSVPRATTRNTYQAIINDFKKAATLLKGQTDIHRATEWSAKAGLAKVYLFAEKKDSAKIYLEDCINNSGKSLVSFNAYRHMFNANPQYEYNSESFYEIGNMADPVNGSAYGSPMTGSTTSMLYSQFYIDAAGNRSATSYSNQYMHDRNLTRFGYNDPPPLTQLNASKTGLLQSYIDQQKERRAQAGRQVDGPDPRLWVSALQPFFDSCKVAGVYYKIAQGEFGNQYVMDPATGNNANTFYGWNLRKYQYLDGKLAETRNVAGYNFYFIRLPDIYLMYAEILKSSNPALALEYINKVHRRAYGYLPNVASPVDYTSLTDRTKAPADDHLANNPLLYERWAEFFGEAKWWEDIRRLNLGPNESSFYKEVAGGKGKIVWRAEHYAMPIPSIEFESNSNPGMIQNPGY